MANLEYWTESQACCDPEWEAAYASFESRDEEVAKFLSRLRGFGVERWPRDLQICELFCGRGSGLEAWSRLGFSRLEGVDLSANLLTAYSGPARTYVGDCRQLAFPDDSRDVVCVQGGLHHLPAFPEDVAATVAEAWRVLRPGGRMLLVEPWITPFLQGVHWAMSQRVLRRVSAKLDALARMTERERETYERWLGQPARIRAVLAREFVVERDEQRWGKLLWMGRKPARRRDAAGEP